MPNKYLPPKPSTFACKQASKHYVHLAVYVQKQLRLKRLQDVDMVSRNRIKSVQIGVQMKSCLFFFSYKNKIKYYM